MTEVKKKQILNPRNTENYYNDLGCQQGAHLILPEYYISRALCPVSLPFAQFNFPNNYIPLFPVSQLDPITSNISQGKAD